MIEGRTILCFASGYDAPPTSKHHVMHVMGEVARVQPEWHFMLISDAAIDLEPYRSVESRHFLGTKPYANLPAYCRQFDVGPVSFNVDNPTKAVDPSKPQERLSANLPVVSTPLPESERYRQSVEVVEIPYPPKSLLPRPAGGADWLPPQRAEMNVGRLS